MYQNLRRTIFLCVKDLCFSNIPSKSDLYKYYCHRFSLGKYLREIKRKFSTTSIVWPFDLHAVITKSQFICRISVQGRLSVYRQSLLSPFMSFLGNEKMGKWRKVVKLPLFACKARDNWEVRFVTCPIARMPYNLRIERLVRTRNYSAPPMGMSNRLTVVLQQELHWISNFRSS